MGQAILIQMAGGQVGNLHPGQLPRIWDSNQKRPEDPSPKTTPTGRGRGQLTGGTKANKIKDSSGLEPNTKPKRQAVVPLACGPYARPIPSWTKYIGSI